MSRHRSRVEAAIDQISKSAISACDVAVTLQLRTADISTIAIDLLTKVASASYEPSFAGSLRRLINDARVDELREAKVTLSLHFGERVSRCLIQSGDIREQRMTTVDISVRSLVRTRWIHIWRDSEKYIEWPFGSI